MKSAEAFGFGRANRTGTSDLVLWSPDGDSGRPVGKGEWRGYPKGRLIGAAFFWLLFFRCWKKSNSSSRAKQNVGSFDQQTFAIEAIPWKQWRRVQ